MNINAFEIYNYLPEKIKELLFSQFMDNLMANVFALANISEEKQTPLHRDTVGVLIGRYDLKQYENMLKANYNLNDNVTATTMALLNEKLFGQITDVLEKSREIYKQFSEGNIENISQPVIPVLNKDTKNPEQLMSYIQELATSIKKEEASEEDVKKDNLEIVPTKIATEEKKIIINANENKPEEIKKVEEKKEEILPIAIEEKIVSEAVIKEVVEEIPLLKEAPSLTPKESMVLKMMKQKEDQSNGKLNDYFKALKDNLDVVAKEPENIFQPPFKATKGRSMMIESSIADNSSEQPVAQEQTIEPKKEPIKYNSFNYAKKPMDTSKPTDEKFIDLGDF